MFKKITYFIMILVLCLGLLVACNKPQSLAAYKADAKKQVEAYAERKEQVNYPQENWAIIKKAVEDGKNAIEEAATKSDVNIVVDATKDAIDAVKMNFNAVMFSNVKDWMHESFLKANLTRHTLFINDEGELVSARDTSYPLFIVHIVEDSTDFNEIFSEFPPGVNFEEEMLVMYIFTEVSGTIPYVLSGITADGEILRVQFKLDVGPGEKSITSTALQRCLVVKLDKLDITTASFIEKEVFMRRY